MNKAFIPFSTYIITPYIKNPLIPTFNEVKVVLVFKAFAMNLAPSASILLSPIYYILLPMSSVPKRLFPSSASAINFAPFMFILFNPKSPYILQRSRNSNVVLLFNASAMYSIPSSI